LLLIFEVKAGSDPPLLLNSANQTQLQPELLAIASLVTSSDTRAVKEISLFIESIVLGFLMAAPVGPVGVLCIRRSLRAGFLSGFVTGLGVAICDSFFAFVASFALSTVQDQLEKYDHPIKLVGGIVLLVVGFKICTSAPPSEREEKDENQWKNFSSALGLALSNPLAVLSFAAVAIGVGILSQVTSIATVGVFVGGVFIGSSFWWYTLSAVTVKFGKHVTPSRFQMINRVCGGVILVFGIWSLIGFFR